MIDPELQHYLSGINQHLEDLKNKKGAGIWRSFFNGMFGAFGYIAGVAFVIVVIGWILNKTGTLSAFKEEVRNFQSFITQAQKFINIGDGQQNGNAGQGSGQNVQTFTGPDGKQYKIIEQP